MVSLRFNLNCQNNLLTRSEIQSSSIYFLSGSLGKFICVGDRHRSILDLSSKWVSMYIKKEQKKKSEGDKVY